MSEDNFHTEQERQFKHHCGECARFVDDVTHPYCRIKYYFAGADKNDGACEYFVINNADNDRTEPIKSLK